MAKPMTTEAIEAEKKSLIERFLTMIAKWKTILSPLSHRLDEIEDAVKYFAEVSESNQETLNTMKSLLTTCEKVDTEDAYSILAAIDELKTVIYSTERTEYPNLAEALKELEPYGFSAENAQDITVYQDDKLKKVFLQIKDNLFEVDAEYSDTKKHEFKQLVFKKYTTSEIPDSATKILNLSSALGDSVVLYDNTVRCCMVSLLQTQKVALESKYIEKVAPFEQLKIAREENGVKIWVNDTDDLMAEDINSGNTYKVIKKGNEFIFTYKRAGLEKEDYQELGTIDANGTINLKNMSVDDRKFLLTDAARKYFNTFGLHIEKAMASWQTVGENTLSQNGISVFTQNKELLEQNLPKIISNKNLVSKIEFSYGGKEAANFKFAITENADVLMTTTKEGVIDTVFVANKDSKDNHLSPVIEDGKINDRVFRTLSKEEQVIISNLYNHFIKKMDRGEAQVQKTQTQIKSNTNAINRINSDREFTNDNRPRTVERA